MTNIFAPGIYTTNWYNGGDQNNTAYISDKVSILVGMPRIRQLRIRQGKDRRRLAMFFVYKISLLAQAMQKKKNKTKHV